MLELDRSRLVRHAGVATVLLVVIALVIAPGAARAADATIEFSGLTPGTPISSQYQSQGVVFGQSPSGADQPLPLLAETPSGPPPSPGAEVGEESCGVEVCAAYQWISFTTAMNHVSVQVTASGATSVTVTAEDGGGNPIDSTTSSVSNGGFTLMSVSAPGNAASIRFVKIDPGPFQQGQNFAFTDVTYGPVPVSPPPPDFGLVPNFGIGGAGINVVAGGGQSVANIILRRYNGSAGPIGFASGPLPSGVGVSIQPDPASGGDFTTVVARFIASSGAPPVVNFPVVITGTPSAGAGSAPRSVTIPVTVTGNFDLRLQGIEVTQGVQATGTLLPFFSGGQYSGVPLAAFKKTVVRVYADAHGAPGGIAGVTAVLHVFRNGVELPGSPLNPDYGPTSTLPDTGEPNPAPVLASERETDSNAYTFTLPIGWADGTVNLVADIVPPTPAFSGPQILECGSAACQANDSFTLNSVQFNPTNAYNLCPIALTVNGQQPPPPDQAFLYAKAVTPAATLFVPNVYLATIDATSADQGSGRQNGSDTQDLVEDWDDDNGKYCDGAIGVIPTGTYGQTSGNDSEVDYNPASGPDNRPLSSVAHELFHQLGLPHASNECGGGQDGDSDDQGQHGESWTPTASAPNEPLENPPDDGVGQLNGIGLDTTSEPYKLLADGLNGVTTYNDFMSYCAPAGGSIGFGDVGQWVSPRNWNAAFSNVFSTGDAHDVRASAARAGVSPLQWVAAIHPSQLRVIGFITKFGTEITSVGPNIGPGSRNGSTANSSITLIARGAHGQTLASVPMAVTIGHRDQVGPLDSITAVIPAAAVDSIAVESNGTVVATRTRPKHAPRARILAPRAGARVGRHRTILVRWKATNPEHLKLTASVDYTRDGGRTWRTIYIGPNRGRASLPSFYFAASKRARVRVRVNDGFNETVAVSATFTALGTPPVVTIAAPGPRSRLAGDARLVLSGTAYDQLLRQLAGRSLRWFDGPLLIGTGANLTAAPLPPGRNRIRLVATDATGSASASVVANVTPVSLPYLKLRIPSRVKPSARTLPLTASSAVRATLRVGRVIFHLDRRTRKLRVRIKPGRTPLLLELTATVNGNPTPFAAAVGR